MTTYSIFILVQETSKTLLGIFHQIAKGNGISSTGEICSS